MQFDSITSIQQAEFTGFQTVADLQATRCSAITKERGVYLFIRDTLKPPRFLATSTGGHFKGRNPAVDIPTLQTNWVDGAKVVYIGKAGSLTGRATLKSRLWQYMRFGMGYPVGHWGGRYIWHLADALSLIVCWKPTPHENPGDVESRLIQEFRVQYGKRPFANLAK
jgi:hypothetical protein